MKSALTWRRFASLALAAGVLLIWPSLAVGQGVGSGTLTSTLVDTEPESGTLRIGPLRVTPGLTIREIGHDDNVFDDAENPKEDWMIAATPEASVFTRLRFVQLSAYFGSELQYYHEYGSERAIGHDVRGRVDLLLSRFSPFFGLATTRNRTRPNGEVDVRADVENEERSGGLAYELSANSKLFAAVIDSSNDYGDAVESGVDLQQSLSRRARQYRGGFRTELTPLLTMTLNGEVQKDEFRHAPLRNGEARNFNASFRFDTDAVISGGVTIGYQNYEPVDPLVERFRGVTGTGFIAYPFLEMGHFNFGYNRSIQYSFEEAEAYYLQNSLLVIYTHRLFGEVDVQGQAARSFFDYGNRAGSAERRDSLESYNGNLGYNLRNRTRISANYDYARRRSPDLASRNYIRRRVFLSWAVAF